MPSAVDICSAALVSIGAHPINSLDDENDRARACKALWEIVRDDALRDHAWNCATKRQTLAALSETPEDYTYQFNLPTDWLRMLSVGEYGNEPDYLIEGRRVLCDVSPLKIRYIFRNESVSTWDASLCQAVTLLMSSRLAYAITQSAGMEEQRYQLYMRHIQRARAIDGQDEPPKTLGDSPLLAARYSRSW
jgi:hypothetical protein